MSWTRTTVSVGTCSVLNSEGVTEAVCDSFSGSTWTETHTINVLTQDTTPVFDSTDTYVAPMAAVPKVGGTHALSGTPVTGCMTVSVVSNSVTLDAVVVSVLATDDSDSVATKMRTALASSSFVASVAGTGSNLVVTYDATAGDSSVTINANSTGMTLGAEGTVATNYTAATLGDVGLLRVYNDVVYERGTGTQVGFEVTFVGNAGNGFNSFTVNLSSLDDVVMSGHLSANFNFYKGFGDTAAGWQSTGNNRNYSVFPTSSTASTVATNVITGYNAGTILSGGGTRTDTINYLANIKSGDDTTVQFFKVDNTDVTGTPTVTDGSWAGNVITSATQSLTDSGNPDVNPYWTATTKSTTNDDLGEDKDEEYAALTGVTYSNVGPTHVYTIGDDTVRVIKGRVRVDTRYNIMEELYSVPSSLAPSATEAQSTCDYRVGIAIAADNYTGGIGLIVVGVGNYGGGGHLSRPLGHQLTIAGSVHIDADILGPFGYNMYSGGSLNNNSPASIVVNDNLTVPISSKITGGSFNTNGLETSGGATVINNSGGSLTYSGNRKNCVVAVQNESSVALNATTPGTSEATATYMTYRDSDFNNNTVDFGAYTVDFTLPLSTPANGTRIQNTSSGSALNYNGSIGDGVYSEVRNTNVYALGTQVITTDFQDTSGNALDGTLLIADTNRNSDLEVTVASGTDKTSLTAFDDDEQFTYRGDISNGAISAWTATGGFAAGTLVQARGDYEIVLWIYSSTLVTDVIRARAANNTGIWKRDIRGKSSDITSDDLDVFDLVYFWSYGFGVTALSEKIAKSSSFLYKRFLPPVAEATMAKADVVIAEALSTKGGGLSYTNSTITLTTELTLGELLGIITLRKETDTADEDLPSRKTKIINGDGTVLDLIALTNSFSGSGKLKAGDGYESVKHDTTLDLSDFILADSIIVTAPTLTNLPTAIGASTLNPTNAMTGTGGHTAVAASIINSNLSVSGSTKNVFGGTINGTYTLTGGDTDFNGAVDEVGGLTTGNIALNSSTKRTVDFKAGSITNGTIIASTATNLVLNGRHDKAVTRSVGTATTTAGGTLTKELTLGAGVLTTTSTLDAKETITAGNGAHVIAGLIAKKLTLGAGDSSISATVSSGGVDFGTGKQTISGNITGGVETDGYLETTSEFISTGNLTAFDGDNVIGGTITGYCHLDGDADTKNIVSATISGNLEMGAGTKNQVTGSVTGSVESDGTIDTTTTFVGGSTVTANTATGECNVDGTIAGNVLLGSAGSGGTHTVGADIGTSGTPATLTLGTGDNHEVSGNVSGAVSTTGTLSTQETFQCGGTVTANTATGDSNINTNSTGITGNVLLGNATNGHSFPGKAAGTLTMGSGAHSVDGQVTGAVTTSGSLTTGLVSNCQDTVTSTAASSCTINGTVGKKLTLGAANHTIGATISSGGMTLGAGNHTIDTPSITGAVLLGAGSSTLDGAITGSVTLGAGNHTLNATIIGDIITGEGNLTLNSIITGDLATGDGDLTTGFNFSMDGTLNPGTGSLTFKSVNDVSKIDLVALDGKDTTVYGKTPGSFKSVVQASTGTITFPTAATRLSIGLSQLPEGATYLVLNDSVIYDSGTVDSNGASDLELSNKPNDDSRVHISSGFGGNWYLYYVAANRSATFKGVSVTETSSLTVVKELLLLPTEFPVSFEASTTSIDGRVLIVADTDFHAFTDTSETLSSALTSSGVLNFSNAASATDFMVAVNGTGEAFTASSIFFLRVGTSGVAQDFGGATFTRTGSSVAVSGVTIDQTLDTTSNLYFSITNAVAEFDLSGCPVGNWADEPQSSALVAKARNSTSYLKAIARQLSRANTTIPTDGSVVTLDIVRPVINGADWRDGRYYIKDDEDGTQKVSGWYEVEDGDSFNAGIRTDRQLTDLTSSIDSNKDTQVQSQVRLLASANTIADAVGSGLKEPLNNLGDAVFKTSIGAVGKAPYIK